MYSFFLMQNAFMLSSVCVIVDELILLRKEASSDTLNARMLRIGPENLSVFIGRC